jgi:hypothetical protein
MPLTSADAELAVVERRDVRAEDRARRGERRRVVAARVDLLAVAPGPSAVWMSIHATRRAPRRCSRSTLRTVALLHVGARPA